MKKLGLLVAGILLAGEASAAPPPDVMTVTVDATDAGMGRLHNHLVIPARPGALTLAYPKWIPGEHGPTGPLNNLVNLRIKANGELLAWKRNADEMYELTVTVPAGAAKIEVDFDEQRTFSGSYSGSAVANVEMIDVTWNQALLYPRGARPSALVVEPTVKLPKGWKFATALGSPQEHDGVVTFAKTTLEMLVDSPLEAGRHLRSYDLGTVSGTKHSLVAVGENEESLVAPPELVAGWKRLVEEANALFGAHHYDHYAFLLVLSENVDWFGLEHHQSSQDYEKERTLTDPDVAKAFATLLPHEYVHSWNGKYRRPRGLATPNYQDPMRGELLWVYEGLTDYLGWVLGGRSGLATLEDSKQNLAAYVTEVDIPGRGWRPLADTAVAASLLNNGTRAGMSARRGLDYYPEGTLIWLDADVLIRQKTNGAKSLDDFCQRFHGGKSGPPEVRPYDLEEVIKTLNDVVAYDWKTFLDDRIYKLAPKVPLGGIEGGGYKVVKSEKKTDYLATREKVFKVTTYEDSLGFAIGEDNVIRDVLPGSPADRAGLVPRLKILAVNGRKVSPEQFASALAEGKKGKPIEIITEQGGYFRSFAIGYQGGEAYRSLERDPSKPDLLEAILKAKVTTSASPK